MPETRADALRRAVAELSGAGVPDPVRDARRLLSFVLGGHAALHEGHAPLTAAQAGAFDDLIARRARRQPVSQLLGYREFWGRSFHVTSDVLDPRPETETLIEAALEASPPPRRILDLGTGSGAILLTLLAEWPDTTGTGTDISGPALEIAARNAAVLGVADRAEFIRSDWFSELAGTFDMILSNPPYISEAAMAELDPEVREWEPHGALTPGGDGLDAYRIIAARLRGFLAPGGRALLEIGWDQGEAVRGIFSAAGFADVRVLRDLGGRARVVSLSRDDK